MQFIFHSYKHLDFQCDKLEKETWIIKPWEAQHCAKNPAAELGLYVVPRGTQTCIGTDGRVLLVHFICYGAAVCAYLTADDLSRI